MSEHSKIASKGEISFSIRKLIKPLDRKCPRYQVSLGKQPIDQRQEQNTEREDLAALQFYLDRTCNHVFASSAEMSKLDICGSNSEQK